MEVPNYFIADLPSEAPLTEAMISDACHTLRRNREQYLATRTTSQLIQTLADVAAQWLNPDDSFRRLALEHGPRATGFSRPILEQGLDHFFSEITFDSLESLCAQDLGNAHRLDAWTTEDASPRPARQGRVFGHDLIVHITAGNIPVPAMMSLILGLLTRSAQFLKCARGTSLLPRLLAHSIYREDSKLASSLELAEWPGGEREDLESVLFRRAGAVTATGRDETLHAIRERLGVHTRFLGYGHKFSYAFLAKESLTRATVDSWARAAAEDVTAWDQHGCLSPHDIFVETGGSVSAEWFAERLAEALERREESHPRGSLEVEEAASIQRLRDMYQLRGEAHNHTRVWTSRDSTAWTVVYEEDPLFQPSCHNRFIYVKPVSTMEELLKFTEPVHGLVSTVGLGAAGSRARDLALALAASGVNRICPLGTMQRPPLAWRHDGRPSLGDLVRWVDWEGNRR